MIKVSAIVSTYNSERFIKGCIKDLINQTLYKKGELEIVVIDSCSTQKEKIIVKNFQKKYKNITYKRTCVRESIYMSWNRGISIAKGIYITNSNTDDRHSSNSLEIQSNYLESHSKIDLVYTDCYVTEIENETFDQNNHLKRYIYNKYNGQDSLLMYQFGIHPMWRKKIHNRIEYFPNNISIAGDYWLNLQIASYGKAHHINKTLGLYLKRKDALSFKDNKIIDETFILRNEYRKDQNLIKIYRNINKFKNSSLDKIYYDMGTRAEKYFPPWLENKTENDYEFSLSCILKSIKLNKSNIKKHFKFIKIFIKMLLSYKSINVPQLKKYFIKYIDSIFLKRKVVFLHPYDISINGANGGGANSTIALAEGIAKLGYIVDIYGFTNTKKQIKNEVNYYNIPKKFILKKYISAEIYIVVVYDNKLNIINNFYATNKATKIIIYHNAIVDEGDNNLKKFFMNFPKYVGVVSNYCVEVLKTWGISKDKVIVIPNILKDSMVKYSNNNDIFTHSSYKICFIGGFFENKRPECAIKTIKILHSIDHRYNLYFAGNKPNNIKYTKFIKNSFNKDYIHFLGNINENELVKIYKTSSIVIIPTKIESFGRISLEAQLFGCIPIVNNTGGLPESINNGYTGYLIKNINPDKIIKKILEINSLEKNKILKIRKDAINFSINYTKNNISANFIKKCKS